MKEKIFIQIASYRDPQLLSTIDDCIEKAKYPERLSFGICWQHSKEDYFDDLSEFENDKRFKIINVDYTDSKGCCWARSQTQKLWNGEEYTLQIDSHMKFHPNWDEMMVNYMKLCKSPKPLLTTYPNEYLQKYPHMPLSIKPTFMKVLNINDDGILSFQAFTIDNNPLPIKNPIPGRFLAAGFIFTLGKFCEECPYDPELYFCGEEMSLSARSFTCGYDIFHPPKNIIWHLYKEKDIVESANLHWKDNKKWSDLENISKQRIKKLFGIDCKMESLGVYGFGNERTIKEYEEYCGVYFSEKKVTEDFDYNPSEF
jgi:hypothetical protein